MKKNKLFQQVFLVLSILLSGCGNMPTIAPSTDIHLTVTQPTEVPPTPTAEKAEIQSQPTNSYGITNSLDEYSALPDGYTLYGNISWTDPLIPPYGASALLEGIQDANGKEIVFENADVKDANGTVIPFEGANSGIYPDPQDEHRQYWAFKLNSPNLAAPLRLSFLVTANLPVDGGSFTFDPGPNPQLGQKWEINQDVAVNQETIHVLSVEEAGIEEGFFLFTMQSDSNIVGASITDLEHPPVGGGGGGGEIPGAGAPFHSGYGYQTPLPKGPYTLTFTNLTILVPGDWILTWAP